MATLIFSLSQLKILSCTTNKLISSNYSLKIHKDFKDYFNKYPPVNEGALAPVGYSGFRWATQLDPLWNVYFLGIVLSIANKIEDARIPTSQNCILSYRYMWNEQTADIFDTDKNWKKFITISLEQAKKYKYVVACDISEFYARLSHHRLENALKHLDLKNDIPFRIMTFLGNFSNTDSFGLPVGGPAARILSELVLNQIDLLLRSEGIKFCRFADDYHFFAQTQEECYDIIIYLSEKLLVNQGLQLQKSKTKIMSGPEFIATSPLNIEVDDEKAATQIRSIQHQAKSILQISLRFDPYSDTADDDYEALKKELTQFDIFTLLKSELSKSRIHISLAKN